MVLSDRTIKEELASGRIVIDPLGEGCIQPASVDLRLDRQILEFHPERYSYVDIREPLADLTEPVDIPDPAPYILKPDQFILASTVEYVELPDDVVARLEGKSSLGRLGLMIHSTAGYVDPGWKGQLTLEISNVAGANITLYYGMRISQISFLRLSSAAERPYGTEELGSKYQGQLGPTASRSQIDYAGANARRYLAEPTKLRQWLNSSEYEGSVTKLARVLDVPDKTAQDWVYGRNQPSAENRVKLYAVTGISDYAPHPEGRQGALLGPHPEQGPLFAPDSSQPQ